MIARQEVPAEKGDVWSKLAAPLPQNSIAWRQDGRVFTREGKPFARFVAYVEANTVRERLDAVVPGEWDLTLDLLPPTQNLDNPDESNPKTETILFSDLVRQWIFPVALLTHFSNLIKASSFFER